MKNKLFIIAGALVVTGAAAAAALYYAYPVRVSLLAGLTRNYFLSWSAPPGTAKKLVFLREGSGALITVVGLS
jgi:hypothetical protein